MDTELEKLKYIAAARVALHKEKWYQLIGISEHILRLEKLEEEECQNSD